MNHSINIIAKLLATENINVVKKAVKTASFNIQSRQLTLPIFKNMTPEIEGMMVGHEVGHALFTTMDLVDASVDNRKLHSYLNVIEDVRIEKLMKRKYPGLKKSMVVGYNHLNERDFFGLSKIKNVQSLNLIDKINLWFKVGISSGVTFTKEEQEFVIRSEKVETTTEVIELAKEILEFSKNELKKDKKREQEFDEEEQQKFDEEEQQEFDDEESDEEEHQESDDEESDDEEIDESDDEEIDSNCDSNCIDDDEEQLESKTSKALEENLDEYLDLSSDYVYVEIDTNFDPDTFIDYKTILNQTTSNSKLVERYWSSSTIFKNTDDEYNIFKTNTMKTVSYLLKEFEMKKAATQYKRTQVSKSGALDMKKIWGYQFNDDLFKRLAITNDGKKHGMIFLVDWSGSMSSVINDVVQQVITLSMFCYRAQIPFQVLAFSDYYIRGIEDLTESYYKKKREKHDAYRLISDSTLDNAVTNCSLLELFSNKMSISDFNGMAKRLFNIHHFCSERGFGLGGTPLLPALAYMTEYVGKFIRLNGVEKMSMITLTDGAGGVLNCTNSYRKTVFLTDPVTKINYEFGRNASDQTDLLLQILKRRYDVTNVGFYVTPSASRIVLHNLAYDNGIDNIDTDKVRTEIRANGFASFRTKGRDDLFVVPANSLKIDDKELSVNSSQSTKSIANKFTKMMESRQVNRLLLNKFISYVA